MAFLKFKLRSGGAVILNLDTIGYVDTIDDSHVRLIIIKNFESDYDSEFYIVEGTLDSVYARLNPLT